MMTISLKPRRFFFEYTQAGLVAIIFALFVRTFLVQPELDNFGPLAIPEGQYFVMGDNRDNSLDSREWGLVPRDHIIGRGLLIYWSFVRADANGARAAGRRPTLTTTSRLLASAGAFFTGTRWDRSGRLIR